MKQCVIVLLMIAAIASKASAQLRPWPDAVVLYQQGPNATPGYDSTNLYFPQNVLGPPDSAATGVAPAFSPQELQALGTGGVIVLKYNGRVIVNGSGPDLTVFENGLYVGGDSNTVFREVGIVSVSKDGVTYIQFPYQGAPVWHNLAGATPTWGGNPLDPNVSGGDHFDLAEIGIDSVRYVKIVDAGALVPDEGSSFDLDAVAALHLVSVVTSVEQRSLPLPSTITLRQNYPNPFNPTTNIVYELSTDANVRLEVFDVLGQQLRLLVNERESAGEHSVTFDASGLPSGVLYYRLTVAGEIVTKKMLLLQ